MTRIGLYMNDLGLHDTSHEMALSGIKPLPQLEMARDHVSSKWLRDSNIRCLTYCSLRRLCNAFGDNHIVKCHSGNETLKDCTLKATML